MRYPALTRWLPVMVVLALCGCGQSGSAPDATSTGTPSNSAALAVPAKSAAAPAPTSKPVVVEAGTVIHVTVDQEVSSKTSNEGDHFQASIAGPVMVAGK
jgi:hypothetical protein